MGYKEVWAYFQSTGGEGFYAYADVEWDSSYYVTVGNIRYSSESSAYWFKWRVGARGNTGSPLAGTDLGPKYSFQGSQNGQYVFQACTRESASSWGGTWDSGGFTLTADSGGSGGSGGGSGGETTNYYNLSYYEADGSTLYSRSSEAEGSIVSILSSGPSKSSTSSSSTFTITGNANGGTFPSGATTSITATKTVTTSYRLSSWNTNNSGTGTSYSLGTTIGMPSYNLNLYPQYTSSESSSYSNNSLSRLTSPSPPSGSTTATYTATFNPNGGSVNTSSQSVTAIITKTFAGWMTSSTGTSTVSTLTYQGTVYAKWGNKYTDNTVILPLPSRSGYNFNGWSTSTSGTNLKAAGEAVAITSNTTFYAIWTEKEKPKGGIFIHDGTMWQLATEYIFNEETWISSE